MSSTASPLETRRARIRQIRARVAAGAVAAFIAVFGFLLGQLSSGSDPGLAATASSTTGTTTTSQNATDDGAATDDSSSQADQSSTQTWSAPAPAAVQTTQS